MLHILDSDVARYRNTRVWAERGLVHVEYGLTGEYESMPVRKMLHRLRAVNDMLGNSRADRDGFASNHLYTVLQRFVEEGVAVCAKAREQGEPFTAEAVREAERRRPKTVCVPRNTPLF